jgi:hypothetical protein
MRQLSVADLFASAAGKAKVAGGTVSDPSLTRSMSVDDRRSATPSDEPPIKPDITQSGRGLHLLHRLLSLQEPAEGSDLKSDDSGALLEVEEHLKATLSIKGPSVKKSRDNSKSQKPIGLQMKQDKESGVPVLLPSMLEDSATPPPSPTVVGGLFLPSAPLFTSPAVRDDVITDQPMVFGSSKSSVKPPLVVPSMFSSPSQPGASQEDTHNAVPELLRGLTSPRTPSESAHDIDPLTKGQLQKAMLHLIKNDDNFLSTLYDAYIKTLHEFTTKKS